MREAHGSIRSEPDIAAPSRKPPRAQYIQQNAARLIGRESHLREGGMTSSDQAGYSPEQIQRFRERVRELRNAQPGIQLDLSHLSEQLSVRRARTFANEALGRRLPVIERAV